MTKYDIYGIALSVFNLKIDEMTLEATEDKPQSREIYFCDMFYRDAELSCAKIYDWTFLYKVHQFTDKELFEDLSGECQYAYKQPDDMASLMFVNGSYNSYIKHIGQYLVFSRPCPSITYTADRVDFENWAYPDDFAYLIGYKLALEICDNVAPDSKKHDTALERYGMVLQQLRNSEIKMKRKKHPDPLFFVY